MTEQYSTKIVTALTDRELAELRLLAKSYVVLELGSQFGASTICMAETAIQVHSVDWHRGDGFAGHTNSLPAFWDNLKSSGLADKVIAHVGRFSQVLPLLRMKSFDMIFIDGSHDYEDVVADIHLSAPLLREENVLAFHDYGRFDGVTKAVQACIGEPDSVVDTLAVFYRYPT